MAIASSFVNKEPLLGRVAFGVAVGVGVGSGVGVVTIGNSGALGGVLNNEPEDNRKNETSKTVAASTMANGAE